MAILLEHPFKHGFACGGIMRFDASEAGTVVCKVVGDSRAVTLNDADGIFPAPPSYGNTVPEFPKK